MWPRGFTHMQRAHFPRRLLVNSQWDSLYRAESWCRQRDDNTMEYTVKIGYGLFTSVSIAKNTVLCQFQGTLCTAEQYATAEAEGRGGYAICINTNLYLDCYNNRANCLASMANCANATIRSVRDGVPAAVTNNARLVVDSARRVAALKSTRNIGKHAEIFWDYGNHYIFPQV